MWCGCSLLLQSATTFLRRPHSWFEALSRHRATTSGAPNFAYELMTAALTAGLSRGPVPGAVTCSPAANRSTRP